MKAEVQEIAQTTRAVVRLYDDPDTSMLCLTMIKKTVC